MAEELQQLLEKIQRDGVDKANAEAKAIVDKANADAKAILEKAEADAKAIKERAKADVDMTTAKVCGAIGNSVSKMVAGMKNGIEGLFVGLLVQDVKPALAANAVSIAGEAIKALATGSADAQVAANAQLAEALRAQLAANAASGVEVVPDGSVGTGFSVRLDGGRVEHDFSEKAIAAALAKSMRPDIAKFLCSDFAGELCKNMEKEMRKEVAQVVG
jgi:V/A-type H+-transporting ATPase subunit E